MDDKSEFDGGEGRHKWALDGCLLCVIGLDFRKVLEALSDLLQEGLSLVVLLVDILNVVADLSEHKISDSEVVIEPGLVALELGEVSQLGLNGFLPGLFQEGGSVGVKNDGDQLVANVADDSDEVEDVCPFLGILAEEFALGGALNDVAADGSALSDLDVSVNEVGEVGEVESEGLLVVGEPLLMGSVLHVSPVSTSVGEEETRELSSSADAPIAQGNLAHLDFFM